jgi:hypothetical protein
MVGGGKMTSGGLNLEHKKAMPMAKVGSSNLACKTQINNKRINR